MGPGLLMMNFTSDLVSRRTAGTFLLSHHVRHVGVFLLYVSIHGRHHGVGVRKRPNFWEKSLKLTMEIRDF
jgi:hypothetical protein